MNKLAFWAGMLFSAILGGIIVLIGFSVVEKRYTEVEYTYDNRPKTEKSAFSLSESPSGSFGVDFVQAAQRITPAVVHIQTFGSSREKSSQWQRMMKEHFGVTPQNKQMIMGAGSGVIISEDGYIATNAHVIDAGETIRVILNDKRSFEAELIGRDATTDLALLKIEAENLTKATFGNSDSARVGEWVIAVGNPFDLTSTVTAGILSAKGRNINILRRQDGLQIEAFLQTDAAVNPGNSGGPLVNAKGELLGINTAIATRTGTFSGYSFAVPSSLAFKVLEDLREFGEVQRAVLGIRIQDVNAQIAENLKLEKVTGVLVIAVGPTSGAGEAGVKNGDVILAVNGMPTDNTARLQELVARQRPDDEVDVKLLRNGQEMTLKVTLKNAFQKKNLANAGSPRGLQLDAFGINLRPLNDEEIENYGDKGVLLSRVEDGPFAEAGVREGSVLVRVAETPTNSPIGAKKLLEKQRGEVSIEILTPEGEVKFLSLNLPESPAH